MIQRLAKAFVDLLEKHNAVRAEDRDVYIYGCDIALYTVLSTAGLLIIGACLGRILETIICVNVFYLNQTIGGGYHATTHMRCFLTMAIGLLLYLLTFLLSATLVGYATIGYASLIILYCIPLVLHKNKRYLLNRQDILKKRSRIAVIMQMLVFLFILIWGNNRITHAVTMSFVLCALSRCVVAYFHKHKVTDSNHTL